MKTLVISLFAFVASPAAADVYRCTSGHKTIYQDVPCANAKLVENTNGRAPSPDDQMKALEQVGRQRAAVDHLQQQREFKNGTVTTTQTALRPSPPALRTNRTDKYHNRPKGYTYRR